MPAAGLSFFRQMRLQTLAELLTEVAIQAGGRDPAKVKPRLVQVVLRSRNSATLHWECTTLAAVPHSHLTRFASKRSDPLAASLTPWH
jgi:hypothetical protein